MKLYDVVHLSPTPLVGAPGKIVDALEAYSDYSSKCFIFNDYPGELKGKFLANSTLFSKETEAFIIQTIENAKILHIHNFIPLKYVARIKSIVAKYPKKLIYHAHSPLREGPVFFDYARESSFDFDAKLVVAQYHPRQYPDSMPVPNLVMEAPSFQIITQDEKPVILFSPAHKRTGGRWNDKVSESLDQALESIQKLDLAEVIYVNGIHPNDLFFIRRSAHITIDEIVTGAFHQISLEGLATGNVVINNADWFSCQMLASSEGKSPPFIRANNENIGSILLELVQNKAKIAELQQQSYDYFTKNLAPSQLIQKYVKIYDKVLNDA